MSKRRVVQLANPKAAAFLLPNAIRCRVVTLYCIVATSAVVGNRTYGIMVTDKAGFNKAVFPCAAVMTASKFYAVTAFAGANSTIGNSMVLSIPEDFILENGDLITFVDSSSISATDLVSNISAVVELVEEE